MVTRDIIDKTFIQMVVNRDTSIIYDTQADVVFNVLNKRSGNLRTSFSKRDFSVDDTTFSFPIVTYLRFLDIHYRKAMISERRNLAVYNRVIWGVLYRETMPDLRYGLTENIRSRIRAEIIAGTSPFEIPFPD